MADTKISLLPAQTTLATNDVIPLVSTDNSETRKITAANAGIALAKIGLSVGSVAPNSPYTGQPWIDTSAATPLLKVYTGSTWAISSVQPTSIVTSPGNSAPASPTTGVMWFDTSSSPNQLKVWNGSNWTQIDPDAVNQTSATGSAVLPAGTTAQRDGSPAAGYLRYNSTLSQFEGYNGSAWGAVGGGATGGAGNYIFYENDQTITVNYTITSGKNAMTAGPVTVNAGITVTVPSGSTWTVV